MLFPPGPGPSQLAFPLGFVMQSTDGGLRDLSSLQFHWIRQFGWHRLLSHLLIARGWQAGTALSFTSLLLPQSESTQPPKAASPVTTTTNKQPPAQSHCAGACQRREQRSTAGADGWRHHGAPGRRRRARLSPEGLLGSFTFRVFPTPKRLTPNPEFRRARQKGLPREQRSGERLRRPQPLIGSTGVHSLSPARTEPAQPIGARTDRNDPILERD